MVELLHKLDLLKTKGTAEVRPEATTMDGQVRGRAKALLLCCF
jgi:hypothetical protein